MKITGTVVKGEGLGYKTANLKADQPFKLADGVYLAEVFWQSKKYQALAIMGIREDIEVFLLDFDGDLYGQILEVEIIQTLRDLIKYKSREELLRQIEEDIEKTREYFNKR